MEVTFVVVVLGSTCVVVDIEVLCCTLVSADCFGDLLALFDEGVVVIPFKLKGVEDDSFATPVTFVPAAVVTTKTAIKINKIYEQCPCYPEKGKLLYCN